MSDEWRNQAACSGLPTKLFYPERGDRAPTARAVCRGCPVSDDCLEYAFREDVRHGIFGGKTEDERQSIRRRRNKQRKEAKLNES